MSGVDIWRIGNAILATGTLLWLLWDLRRRAKHLPSRALYMVLALAGFLFVAAESSIESIVLQLRPGLRMVLITAAIIWTLIGLWLGRKDDLD